MILLSLYIVTLARADDSAKGIMSVAEIRAIWKQRQEHTQNYCFEWTQDVTRGRGSMNKMAGQDANLPNVPPEDVTFKNKCRMVADQTHGRYSETGDSWSLDSNTVVPIDDIQVAGPSGRRTFNPATNNPEIRFSDIPLGTIVPPSPTSGLLSMANCFPISLCYRILDPAFQAFSTTDMQIGEPTTINGRDAVLVTFPQRGGARIHLWLSPEQNYVPIRHKFVNSAGKTTGSYEISYVNNAKDGWVPSEWVATTLTGEGKLNFRIRVNVTQYFINGDVAKEDFKLEFPAGTWVNDRVNDTTFVVLKNGDKRTVGPMQGMDEYNEIMAGTTAPLKSTSFSWRWFFVAANVVVVIGLLSVWYRRKALRWR